MKQLIRAIALIALVSLFFTCAFAEGGSFEELVAQRQELDRQVIAAGIGSFTIGQGTFEVGVDLPAGSYRVETKVMTAISVYEAASIENAEPLAEYTVAQKEPLEEFVLAEGNVLVMTGSQMTFTVLSIEGDPVEGSLEDLQAQRQALTEQLTASADYATLKSAHGTYTVGIDLPAGTYSTSNPPMTVVGIYNGDPHVDENLATMYTVTAKEPVEKFQLEEGQILVIDGMTEIEISTFIGLKF